jgi:hypothetical protein
MKHPLDDHAEEVRDPCVYTYTAALPFSLGVEDDFEYVFASNEEYADPVDRALYGDNLTVRIRAFTYKVSGLPMWPTGMHQALLAFYDHDFGDDPDARFGDDDLSQHYQWISMETPSAPSAQELKKDDPAFAFHRCLSALNLCLRGIQAATADITIRPITSHDLRPIVVIGALLSSGDWQLLNSMLMHPEARPDGLAPEREPIAESRLEGGVSAVLTQKPYLTTMLWRARAQRALRQTGDPAEAIISFQISAESLLFDTYRMLLIDEGLSSAELDAELELDRTFKSLVTRTLPARLGGRWDVTAAKTPVGGYWAKLYQVRNAIVHVGAEPHAVHAEAAQDGYRQLRDHLEDRLRAKRNVYPRTTYARLGEEGLKRCGRLPRKMRNFLETVSQEPGPWYWPYDLAERDPPDKRTSTSNSQRT